MTDERLPWFKCFPSKWLGALAGMTASEGYVYLVVCFRIYETGEPCRDSAETLGRRTHLKSNIVKAALDTLFLNGKLVKKTEGITNPFAEKLLGERRSKSKVAAEQGSKGGKARAKKAKEKQGDYASEGLKVSKQNPTDLDIDKDKKIRADTKSHSPNLELAIGDGLAVVNSDWPQDAFDRCWEHYPNKIAKAVARKSFAKVMRNPPMGFGKFCGALRRYIQKTDDRPWCHFSTWLNQERWNDIPPESMKGHANGGRIQKGGSVVDAGLRFQEHLAAGGKNPHDTPLFGSTGSDTTIRLLPKG